MDSTNLLFEGELKASYSDGDSSVVEGKLKIYFGYTDDEEFEVSLTLPRSTSIVGQCRMGTQAYAKESYDKNIKPNRSATSKGSVYSYVAGVYKSTEQVLGT